MFQYSILIHRSNPITRIAKSDLSSMSFKLCLRKGLHERVRQILIRVNFANTDFTIFNFIPNEVESPAYMPGLLV